MSRPLIFTVLTLLASAITSLLAADRADREVVQGEKPVAAPEKNKLEKPAASTPANAPKPSQKPEKSPDKKTTDKPSDKNAGKKNHLPGITHEREAAVMAFVKEQHPELAELLLHLKENNSHEYEQAVRDLLKTSERLALLHERDSERYELELKLWQAQSRSDLLSARIKMSATDELKSELTKSLSSQFDLRKAILKLERDRLQEKTNKLDEQLSALEKSRDVTIKRQLSNLVGPTEPPAKNKTKKSK